MTTPTTRPKLKRPAFHVWLAPTGVDPDTATEDELDYHHVVVHHADQLRAELEASKLKLDARKFPMHLSSMWLWASLVRTGVFTETYTEFKRAMVSYDADKERPAPHTDPEDELETDEHDARPTAAAPATGWTPSCRTSCWRPPCWWPPEERRKAPPMSDVALAIRLTADADQAVAAANDVGDAFDRAAADVDDSTSRMDSSASRMDSVGESADDMASKSAQAAGGIGDLAGALASTGLISESTAGAMELGSTAIMGVTGASDLLNLATTSTTAQMLKSKAAAVATTVATKAQAVATKAMAVAQRILNVAMRANPIGLIITAVIALAALFITLYKRSTTFRNIVNTVMRAVRGYIMLVVNVLRTVWDWLSDKLPAGFRVTRDKAAEAWQWIKEKAGAAWEWIRDKVADVVGRIRDRVASIRDTVSNTATRIRTALGNAWDWVMRKLQPVIDAVGDIKDALGNLHMPDLNPFNNSRTITSGASGRMLTAAPSYSSSTQPNVTIENIEVSGIIGEADAGALLTTIIDRYLRQQGRSAVFGT